MFAVGCSVAAPPSPRVVAPAPVEVEASPLEPQAALLPDARRRAAWGMLLYMRALVSAASQFHDVACDPSLDPTFGIAKTDPWDHAFAFECVGDEARLSSAGPDGVAGTSDDVRSWEPLVGRDEACARATRRAEECRVEVGNTCMTSDAPDVWFSYDTCAVLSDCTEVRGCLESIPPYLRRPEHDVAGVHVSMSPAAANTSCETFVRIASSLVTQETGSPPDSVALRRACEDYGSLRYSELACMEASATPREAALCHLTVYRGWADPDDG